MVPWPELTALLSGYMSSLVLVWAVLRLNARFALAAAPNARSFHDAPTPTLGGVGFVVPCLAGLCWAAVVAGPMYGHLAAAAALVAGAGLWDDLQPLSRAARLACHTAGAALIVTGLAPVFADHWVFAGGASWIWVLAGGVALVWLINLYNFMDGIDGLAACQAVTFLVGVVVLKHPAILGVDPIVWLLMGSVLGFLAYNWFPASIFMGDVGSGFLGLMLGVVSVLMWLSGVLTWAALLILLATFVFDASYTLGVRVLTGQRFAEAHRSHTYQKLAEKVGHQGATMTFVVFAMFWLLPLAALAQRFPRTEIEIVLVCTACLPLLVAAWMLGAGRTGSTEQA